MVLEKPASAGFFSSVEKLSKTLHGEKLTRHCCFIVFALVRDGTNLCATVEYRECSGSRMMRSEERRVGKES